MRRTPVPPLSEDLKIHLKNASPAPENHQFKPCALQFAQEMTLPSAAYYDGLDLCDDDRKRYYDLVDLVSPQSLMTHVVRFPGEPPSCEYDPIHRMLGHAQLGQVSSQNPASVLLLQLDSDLKGIDPLNPSNMEWEYFGHGYFYISPSDLQTRNFSQIELVYETD